MHRALAYYKKYRYSTLAFSLLGVLLIVSVLLFMSGYRLAPGFVVLKAGTLIIDDIRSGASLYVDHEYSGQSASTSMRMLLTPGSHVVIVSTNEYQPWNELVSMEAGKDTRVRPVYVPKVVTTKVLPKESERAARTLLASYALPTMRTPLSMAGGCAQVYAEYGQILAVASSSDACTVPAYLCQSGECNPTIIFSPSEPLYGIVAFPGRTDTLVIAAGARVYVLELDPRDPKFFSPVIHGENARVIPWSPSSVVVSTDAGIREIPL